MPGETSMARCHVAAQGRLVVDDLHGPAAQDVAGPHQHRVADAPGDVEGLLQVQGGAVGRLLQAEPLDQHLKPLAVLGHVDALDAGADDRRPAASSARARFSGVWPPNCTISPFGCMRSQMLSTSSAVSGSKNRWSLVS